MAFAAIGDPLLEDALSAGGVVSGVEGKNQVKEKMEKMLLDKAHPLNDISHPKHKDAVEEYSKLNAMFSAMK
jgi:hypothetical protein